MDQKLFISFTGALRQNNTFSSGNTVSLVVIDAATAATFKEKANKPLL